VTASLSTLINGHDVIARSVRLLLAMIANEGALPARVPRRLASLAAVIAMHDRHERGFDYAAIAAENHDVIIASFSVDHALLNRDWADYLATWTSRRIACEPVRFRLESRDILARLLQLIDRENLCLYPYALAANALTPI
jgi:hypothetical protein